MNRGKMDSYRVEKDSLGEVKIPFSNLWGAQTERSRHNFHFHQLIMPHTLIHALVIIKKAACMANAELGLLTNEKRDAILQASDEILSGRWQDQFPLSVFQTGSGTQSNMNVNEVIANRAIQLLQGIVGSKSPIHPNDDVNKSQSSNDVFPSAMHVATLCDIEVRLLPNLRKLQGALQKKADAFMPYIKIGRTHLMDAVPMTLGQEFSGYTSQIAHAIDAIERTLPGLRELPLGATAIGTGLNCPPRFASLAIAHISKLTHTAFIQAPNLFQGLASHEALLFCSGALKTAACALFKIASDIRLMGSGPRAGLAELFLPENEPGSSIMPGKVNPTQCEAITMIVAQVMGCDAAISFAASQGHFELNVFKPVIAYNILNAIYLLAEGVESFRIHCLEGLRPNKDQLKKYTDNSLMIATALNPIIGYDNAAKVVQKAYQEHKSIKEVVCELNLMTADAFDKAIDLNNFIY